MGVGREKQGGAGWVLKFCAMRGSNGLFTLDDYTARQKGAYVCTTNEMPKSGALPKEISQSDALYRGDITVGCVV